MKHVHLVAVNVCTSYWYNGKVSKTINDMENRKWDFGETVDIIFFIIGYLHHHYYNRFICRYLL